MDMSGLLYSTIAINSSDAFVVKVVLAEYTAYDSSQMAEPKIQDAHTMYVHPYGDLRTP